MTRIFLTFVLGVSLAFSVAAADPIAVALVTDDNHFPYAFSDQGKPAGIYVKIVETIAARMPAYRVKVTALPWKRALRMTETGEASGVFPPHYFPAERPYLDRYSDPILSETPVLQCNDQTLATHGINRRMAVWPDGYAGITVVTPAGTHMGGDRLRRLLADNGITVVASGGVMENMREVAYGRVDCLLNDRLTVLTATAWLRKNNPQVPLAALAEVMAFPVEQGYLAMSGAAGVREPFHKAFLSDFNVILRHLKDDGALDTLVADYLRGLTS